MKAGGWPWGGIALDCHDIRRHRFFRNVGESVEKFHGSMYEGALKETGRYWKGTTLVLYQDDVLYPARVPCLESLFWWLGFRHTACALDVFGDEKKPMSSLFQIADSQFVGVKVERNQLKQLKHSR